MHLGILSTAPNCYSTRRLVEAASSRGHDVEVINTLAMSLSLAEGEPDMFYKGKEAPIHDAIIPRIGASITYFGTSVLRQYEQMDVYTPNSSSGIINSRDKLRSFQILARHHIGMPETAYVRRNQDILPAIERVGGAPVIIKLIEGTQGVGVVLAETAKVAQAIVEMLHGTSQNVVIQKFVKESKGKDVRAFVVGDQVVAAMRRTAQGDEFRSNVHRGGSVEAVQLPDEYKEMAIRASQILGLRVAGVDMLETSNGPQIMEVNSSPGLEGIEAATKLDIAGAIVDYIADQVNFPEIDIRQKLTVSRGYGVAEISIPEGSKYIGKTIEEMDLKEADIAVLTLKRGVTVISNPKKTRVIEDGDVLLCYGKLALMKSLIPAKVRKRRSKRKLDVLTQEQIDEGHKGES
ncbi:MAG: RimK family alpha-L-glutamate ligase [Lentisphaeraceae bacterium]|nr:RimK family alpha-L-glutamate ligase [Lentisphaeraceae bacterium]